MSVWGKGMESANPWMVWMLPLLLAFGIPLGTPSATGSADLGVAPPPETVSHRLTAPVADCDHPANPIVSENCLPGSDDWQVETPSYSIVGYPLPSSVNLGGSITFYVSTDAREYDVQIYRSGYYGGKGARLITTLSGERGVSQPACLDDPALGLRSCTNWQPSFTFKIPSEWVSGVYLAKLTRPDTQAQSLVTFIVRDDMRKADILYQYSLSTYQAYNSYGGKSLYSFNSNACATVADAPRAVKTSLARPLVVPPFDPTSYFRVDYPMVYWLEEQGYDVSYSTSFDTHKSGVSGNHNQLLDHQIFMAVGHDEYWSREMRDAITEARDAGVNLALFTGNTGYWKIRMEPDPWTGQEDLIMVTYKTAESGPQDPSGDPTSLWRDPSGPDEPENAIVGIQFVGDNDSLFFPLRIPAELAHDGVFRNTGLQDLPPGSYADIGSQIVGWEWDGVVDNGLTPGGLTLLSATPALGEIAKGGIESYRVGTAVSNAARYVSPSGAIVFAAGTIQWSWGLAIVEPDRRLQQITYNILADMGVQPASPSGSLVLDGEGNATRSRIQNPEPRTASVSAPSIESLAASVDGTSASIHWRTDIPTRGEAWLVTEDGTTLTRIQTGPPSVAEDKAGGVEHTVYYSSLTPSTRYHFIVAGVADGGGFTQSDIRTFEIPSEGAIDRIRRSAGQVVQQMSCVARPIGRPVYFWMRNHLLVTALAGLAILAGVAWGGIVLRGRRAGSRE
jgi:hypothetical protein